MSVSHSCFFVIITIDLRPDISFSKVARMVFMGMNVSTVAVNRFNVKTTDNAKWN